MLPAVGIEVLLLLLALWVPAGLTVGLTQLASRLVLVPPLWAAGLYLLFDTLTQFVPAAL